MTFFFCRIGNHSKKGQAEITACPFSFIHHVNFLHKEYFCENISWIIEFVIAADRCKPTKSKNQAKRGMIH